MIETLVQFLQVNILPWGALGVFVASVLEEVIAPIPSAVIVTMAGFIFVKGPIAWGTFYVLLFKVVIPSAFGVTVGSYAVYFVARFGGRYIIERWGKYLGLFWSDIEKLQTKLSGSRRDEVVIVVARSMPFVPSVAISAFCGLMEMGLVKYFVVSFVGVFFRSLILGILGWQVGNVYEKYAKFFSSIENLFLISTVLAVGIFIVLKYRGRRKG